MKNQFFSYRYLAMAAAILVATGIAAPSAQAGPPVLVTYFNFEDQNLVSDPAVPPPARASTITTNFPAGDISFPAGQGSTANLAPGNVQITNSPLRLASKNNNGDYIQFTISTANLQSLSLSFVSRTSSGFATATVSYSLNGTTFVNVGSPYTIPTTYPTTAPVFNFPTAVDNQTSVTFRITFSGAGNNNSGFTDIDNIQLNGVPEPGTVGAGALGVLGLCWHQRRRLSKARHLLGFGRKAAA